MLRFLEAMRALNGEIVPELARQMGRPVRYGGEFRSFEERVQYMAEIAEAALAPVVPEPKADFTRYIRREPLGIILTIAPWNYPFLTAVNTVVPGLIAGNAVILKAASQTIPPGSAFSRPWIGQVCQGACSLISCSDTTTRRASCLAVTWIT